MPTDPPIGLIEPVSRARYALCIQQSIPTTSHRGCRCTSSLDLSVEQSVLLISFSFCWYCSVRRPQRIIGAIVRC